MKINIHRETTIESTPRTELLESMFEVPANTKLSVTLSGELNLDSKPWNIGLIVGPSGSGKTLLLNELFGQPEEFQWNRRSVIDDFDSDLSMESISRVCQSVGFNTIPSWMRPFSVLSDGERFRVSVARAILGSADPIIIDEFTSVVDRQVASFACHSVQKHVRESKRRLVVASCHYDILDWLQPDWILEPGNPCRFTWRSLQGRPQIECSVSRVKYETWNLFKDFHYMSQDLNRAARCYGLYVKTTNTPGLEVQIHGHDVRTLSDESNSPEGSSRGLRIPPRMGMHKPSHDSDVVSGSEDEDSISHSSRSSSSTKPHLLSPRPSTTGNRGVRAGFVRRPNENESLDQSSPKETESVKGSTADKHLLSYEATAAAGIQSDDSANDKSSLQRSCQMVSLSGRLGSPSSNRIASMCGVLYRPHPRVSDIYGFTRMVTLPDFQGLGLGFVLACKVASAYKALGKRLHSYPNHPAWIRSYQRSPLWMQIKESGSFSPRRGVSSTVGGFGGRRCAVFMYIGDAMNREEAERLIHVETE